MRYLIKLSNNIGYLKNEGFIKKAWLQWSGFNGQAFLMTEYQKYKFRTQTWNTKKPPNWEAFLRLYTKQLVPVVGLEPTRF